MNRIALLFCLALTACVLDEATDADLAEVESEAALPTPVTELTNGDTVVLAAPAGSLRYYKLVVPAGFDHTGVYVNQYFSGHADLYIKRGSLPSTTSYECTSNGWDGGCRINYPTAATYYILVRGGGTTGYSGLYLTPYYRNTYAPIPNGYSSAHWNQYGYDTFYKIVVPENVGSLTIDYTLDPSDYNGKMDLVVKRGWFATATIYDCKRWIDGYEGTPSQSCTWQNPTAGTYYIGLLGHGTRVYGTLSARYKFALVPNAPTTTL